jgi:hypothetical protein
MVANRARPADTFDPLGPYADRFRADLADSLREDGALACWGSVLFDIETEGEHRYKVGVKADQALDGWLSGDEDRRTLARLSATFDPEVINDLLVVHRQRAVPFIREVLREAPSVRPHVEAAVQDVCGTFWISKDDEKPADCRSGYFGLLGIATASTKEAER